LPRRHVSELLSESLLIATDLKESHPLYLRATYQMAGGGGGGGGGGGRAGGGGGGGGGKVFKGLTFCVSGAFAISQGEMKKQLEKNGGKVASTVNASVDYLICNEEGSTKYQAAEEKGKPVVSEEWVMASIDSGKLSKDPSHFIFNPNEDGDGEGDGGDGEGGDDEEVLEPIFEGCVFIVDYPQSPDELRETFFQYAGKVVSTFTPQVTHCIAGAFGSELTKKAVREGVPLVHHEWLTNSITDGDLNPTDGWFEEEIKQWREQEEKDTTDAKRQKEGK
jgi:hypothetical protein